MSGRLSYPLRMSPRTDTPAFALGEGYYSQCQVAHWFLSESVLPIVERHVPAKDIEGGIDAAFRRAMYWLSSLTKLNHPSDFQPVIAGARALFELTVDLTLLVGDRETYPMTKLMAWEDSGKLKHAQTMIRLAGQRRTGWDMGPFIGYIREHSEEIQALRDKLWPSNKGPSKHPVRWTGRSLADDAKAADTLGGVDLEDFYLHRHAELCWSTHGSGLTGVRHLSSDQFPSLVAFAFKESAQFGMRCAKLSLRYLDAFDQIAQVKFERAEKDLMEARNEGYANRRPPSP